MEVKYSKPGWWNNDKLFSPHIVKERVSISYDIAHGDMKTEVFDIVCHNVGNMSDYVKRQGIHNIV
jgi:hypothetical protein